MFKMLAPNTLPMAKPPYPLRAEVKVVLNSGRLVPKAMTVPAMMAFETLKRVAKVETVEIKTAA